MSFDRTLRPWDPIFEPRKKKGGFAVGLTPPESPCIGIYSFTDDFNRPNGPVNNGWTDSGGEPQIVSNEITSGSLSGRQLYLDDPMCPPRFWCEIDVINIGSTFGNPEFWISTTKGGFDMYNLGIGPNSNTGGSNDGWRIRRQNTGAVLAYSCGGIPATPFRMRAEIEPGIQRIYGPVSTLRLTTFDTTHTVSFIALRCSSNIIMDNFACGAL